MLRFKIGDWVISPSARKPTWLQITTINEVEKRYVISTGNSIYFESEYKWVKLEEVQNINYIILFINQELNS